MRSSPEAVAKLGVGGVPSVAEGFVLGPAAAAQSHAIATTPIDCGNVGSIGLPVSLSMAIKRPEAQLPTCRMNCARTLGSSVRSTWFHTRPCGSQKRLRPVEACVPSQKGFRFDSPQRQRAYCAEAGSASSTHSVDSPRASPAPFASTAHHRQAVLPAAGMARNVVVAGANVTTPATVTAPMMRGSSSSAPSASALPFSRTVASRRLAASRV